MAWKNAPVTATLPVMVVEARETTHGEVPWFAVIVPLTGWTVVPVGSMRTGLVALAPTRFPPAVMTPISVANAGAATPVAPTEGFRDVMVPSMTTGRGLTALTPISFPVGPTNPTSVEERGAGAPFRPTDALEPAGVPPVPVPCPIINAFAMA